MRYEVVVFDVDGTLTESKMPLEAEMAELLQRLATIVPIAATSGTSFSRFEEMVFPYLHSEMPLHNFYLMPTGGASFYLHDGIEWITVYEEKLTDEEMCEAEDAIEKAIQDLDIDVAQDPVGPLIERRFGTMVAFAGTGQRAPLALKASWDPDRTKRIRMTEVIAACIPWAVVRPAGMTTIDITRKGINKDFGIRKLSEHLHTTPERMLYIGDELFPGGNDEIVKTTGIATRVIKNPTETALVIEELLASYAPRGMAPQRG